jgi:peptidoglycan hydrolase-like protein with peptidoglycan-binding domain
MRVGAHAVWLATGLVLLLTAGPPGANAQTTPIEVAAQKKKAAPAKTNTEAKKPKTQPAQTKAKAKTKADTKASAKPKSKPAPKKGAAKAEAAAAVYARMPIAERAAIQFDLNWTNDYSGQATGDFGERSVAAVKAFQKDRGFKETGLLSDGERSALAAAAETRRERVGWRMIEDRISGAQLGLPTKLAPHELRARSGTRWQSKQGQFQIETFRVREPGATLATVFEEQRKLQGREIGTSAIRDGYFVLTGIQGQRRFLVRAEVRDLEIRGITVLYDRAIEGTSDYVSHAVVSAYAPFPGTGVMALIGPPSPRRIDYGTGIVVTAAGHVVTDRKLTDGCRVLQVAGHGDASRLADRDGMTLLRVFGAASLTPAAIMHDGASASALTLVGIADPQAQGGERTVSTVMTRLDGDHLEPTPQLGFAGAAAIDNTGRLFGMVTLKAPVLAGANMAALPSATVVPVNAIRQFLKSHAVTPSTGRAGIDAAKAAIVRVICVRP